jgi:hypothetical protein
MSMTHKHGRRMYLGDAALARLPLYEESADGKLTPVGPLQSISVLFDDHGGELSEAAVTTIANGYDDPNTMVAALNKLGAIKVRKESGEVVFRLDEEGGARTGSGDSVSSTSGPGRVSTADGTASMAIGFASGSALDNYEETANLGVMMTWREAARLGVPYGAVKIHKDGNGTPMVVKSEVDKVIASAPRGGGIGAGKRIADKLSEATDQRSTAVRAAARARQQGRETRAIRRAEAKPTPGSTAH